MTGASTLPAFPVLTHAERLADEGKLEQAAQLLIGHLRQHPDEPRGLVQLGTTAMRLGALGQAEHFLRRAIMRGNADLATRRSLASVVYQQERLDEARVMFEALARENDDPALAAIHANILDKLGRNEEALAIEKELVERHPDKPPLWVSYGHGLRADGRVEEAIEAYRRSIAIDHEYGDAWWGLASIKRRVLTDEDVDLMHDAVRIAIDVRNSAPLHFALARAHQDRGEYETAFTHYMEGNRQRAEDLRYDARELTAEVDEVRRTVDDSFIRKLTDRAVGEDVPVFIVSLPRSGSTLLEQMLGSHPDVEPVGELPYIPAILRSLMEMATRRGHVSVTQAIAGLPAELAAKMGQDYLRRASFHRKTNSRLFVDKLPHNWSNILFIRRILPQARFIDIRRNAMDCCFSNFSQSFSSAHASSFALEDIGSTYVDYTRLMAHFDEVAPGMIHHVRYETLIEEAEAELKKVLGHLGAEWDPVVLEFHKLDRVVRTPSSEQVRRPLNRDGIDVCRPYEQWLGPLREVLGPLAGA